LGNVGSDDYLIGHAMRVGLAGEHTSQATLKRLLPTIRNDMIYESDQMRDAQFPMHLRLRETAESSENAGKLADFLDIPPDRALEIANSDQLFVD